MLRFYIPNMSIKRRPATAGNEQRLGIEDVTARAGVSERLVRHCESRGLIPGAEEADASWRRYTHEDVSVLSFARRAHVLGFGMHEVARLLSLWQDMHRVSSEVKSTALAQPKELESRIDELQVMECVLERLAHLFSVGHQPTCPILEELMELRAGRSGTVAETEKQKSRCSRG
jgi:MerR family copper efflux transcriptional regulator